MACGQCSHAQGKWLRTGSRKSWYPLSCSPHTCSMFAVFWPSGSSYRIFQIASWGTHSLVGLRLLWLVYLIFNDFTSTYIFDTGTPGPRRQVGSRCRDSKDDHICGCFYNLSTTQSGCGFWSRFFMDQAQGSTRSLSPIRRVCQGEYRKLFQISHFEFRTSSIFTTKMSKVQGGKTAPSGCYQTARFRTSQHATKNAKTLRSVI